MTIQPLPAVVLATILAAACLTAPPARAAGDDPGHDHGGAATTATPTSGPALPRFSAVSETFELVGVLNGKQLTLYLDRAGDNSPVPKAQIELDIAGAKFKAEETTEATYTVLLANAPAAGVLAVTASVTAGNDSDLLAGELDVHGTAHTEAATQPQRWKAFAIWATAGLLLFAGLVWLIWRIRRMRRVAAERKFHAVPTVRTLRTGDAA